MDYKQHPLGKLVPVASEEDMAAIVTSMKTYGWLPNSDIDLLDGMILEGWTRYQAAKKAGVTPTFRDYEGETPASYVFEKAIARRHWTVVHKLRFAETMRPKLEEEASEREKAGTLASKDARGKVSEKIAEVAQTSPATVERYHAVMTNGTPELAEQMDAETISVRTAAEAAKLPKTAQKRVARVASTDGKKAAAKAVQKEKTTLAEKTDAALANGEDPKEETIEDIIKRKNSELEAWCRDLMKFSETMPDDPWLQDMNRREGAQRKLKDCCSTIRSAKCYCPCTKCEGGGCKYCHKTGRLTKFALDSL